MEEDPEFLRKVLSFYLASRHRSSELPKEGDDAKTAEMAKRISEEDEKGWRSAYSFKSSMGIRYQ